MPYRCDRCRREWDDAAAAENEFVCTRMCGGTLVVADSPAVGKGVLADDILASLPAIVAVPLHEFEAEVHPVLRLWHACDAVELTLRYAVMLGVAELSATGPLQPELRASLGPLIDEPGFGKWRGMAEAVVQRLPDDGSLCPWLRALVEDVVVPLLDGPGGKKTAERSLSVLRNLLAHGGGVTKAVGSRLLASWEPRLRAFSVALAPLAEVLLVVRSAPGELGALIGPSAKPQPWSPTSAPIRDRVESLIPRGDEVVAVRGERCLTIWPLAAFGPPISVDPDAPPAHQATPQAYVRRGDVRLQLTAIGSEEAAISHGDDSSLTRFLELFHVDVPAAVAAKARGLAVPGFEAEVRKEGARLVGRTIELDTVRQALHETESGVLWLAGAAGIGKSCLVARIASELLDAPPDGTFVLPYRFKAGNARCSRESFLRYTLKRLPLSEGEEQKEKKDVSAKAMLREVSARLAAMQSQQVLFILDGLDEIAESDRTFASEVVVTLAEKGGKWLCAGRPEGGLPEAFANARAIFRDGLPVLGEGDVRTMLLERIGSRRFTLLKGDRDQGERVVNPFIARVVEAAKGLPLYVELLIQDILGNGFRALDAGEKLPPSLEAYFEKLLRACGIGVVEGLKPHLVATLAVAREPLSPAALSDLMVRGGVLADDDAALPFVVRALAAVGSMVKRTSTSTGEDGYTLYHHALRQHLETSPDAKGLLTLARSRICTLAVEPVEPSRATAQYLHRWGVTHLVDANRHDEAVGLLTNFARLMTRLQVLRDPEGVSSLEVDWLAVAATRTLNRDASVWQDFFRGCVHILRRGNEDWPSYKILLQLAVEHADDSPVTRQAEAWLTDGCCDWLWLRNARRIASVGINSCKAVLEGHRRPVAGFSGVEGALVLPDRSVLSWSWDGTLRIWDVTSGSCRAVLEGHQVWVRGSLLLPDGDVLSWGGWGDLRIWDPIAGTCRAVLEGHAESVVGALLLPDGGVLSWSQDNTLRVWDAGTATCKAVLEGHTDIVNGAMVLPGGGVLSWSNDGTLRVWDATSGACRAVLEGHESWVGGALLMPDASVLSWSSEETLRLWDTATGNCRAVLKGHTGWVKGALLLPDGAVLSWSVDNTLRIWDSTTLTCRLVLVGHTDAVLGALLLPNGGVLSWSWDNTLRVWDAGIGSCRAVLEGHTESVYGAILLANDCVLSWSGDKALRVWDSDTGACRTVLEGHTFGIHGALQLADGSVLSWSVDNTLRVWDAASGPIRAVLEGHATSVRGVLRMPDGGVLSWAEWDDFTMRIWSPIAGVCRAVLDGHAKLVFGAMLLPDGQILSWSADGTLRSWDATTGACRAVLEGHETLVVGALLLPDGGVLSWSHDGAMRIWDVTAGICRAVLEGHSQCVRGALLLPDGGVLTWSDDRTLRVWDLTSAACRAVMTANAELTPGTVEAIRGALLLPDGGVLSWFDSNTLRIWDLATGACRAVLHGHKGEVDGAMLLTDGQVLSWSGDDHTLRIWNAETGACRAILVGHTGWVLGALPLQDGNVLSWSFDKTLRVWDPTTGACKSVVNESDAPYRRTDLTVARFRFGAGPSLFRFGARPSLPPVSSWLPVTVWNSVLLCFVDVPVCAWEAGVECDGQSVLEDGTAAVTLEDGHVFFLKLHHGERRVNLDEARQLVESPLAGANEA